MHMRFHQHIAFPVLLSLAGLHSITGCNQPNVYQEPPPPDVKVASPIVQTVTNYLEETATTEAVAKVEIRARVEGVVDSVNFEPGTDVNQGDLLYEIEPELYQARVESAQAELLTQEARLKKAEVDKNREEELQARKATSAAAVVAAQAEFEGAKAAVLQSQAQLKQAKIDQQYTKVVAPISGRVGKTLVKQGNLVGGGMNADLLTTIIQYDPIYANFNISERRLLELMDGVDKEEDGTYDKKSIAIFLSRENDEDFPFEGHFDYADLSVDQSTGTFLIRGIFPNPTRKMFPGLFVSVRMPVGEQKDAILIPIRALGEDQAGEYVLVVNSENKVERRAIQSGMKVGDMMVVEEGLSADDTIVIDGLQRARPGAKVSPERIELKADKQEVETVSSDNINPPEPSEKEQPNGPSKEAELDDKDSKGDEPEKPEESTS